MHYLQYMWPDDGVGRCCPAVFFNCTQFHFAVHSYEKYECMHMRKDNRKGAAFNSLPVADQILNIISHYLTMDTDCYMSQTLLKPNLHYIQLFWYLKTQFCLIVLTELLNCVPSMHRFIMKAMGWLETLTNSQWTLCSMMRSPES